jgi:hypothetical protein
VTLVPDPKFTSNTFCFSQVRSECLPVSSVSLPFSFSSLLSLVHLLLSARASVAAERPFSWAPSLFSSPLLLSELGCHGEVGAGGAYLAFLTVFFLQWCPSLSFGLPHHLLVVCMWIRQRGGGRHRGSGLAPRLLLAVVSLTVTPSSWIWRPVTLAGGDPPPLPFSFPTSRYHEFSPPFPSHLRSVAVG